MTEKEFINLVLEHVMEVQWSNTQFQVNGPYTTLYWDSSIKDNVPQQSMKITIGEQTFEVIVRNKTKQ